MTERMKHSIISGAILGIFCIIGAYVRSSFEASLIFVFSLWYNRVVIGLVIGSPWPKKVSLNHFSEVDY